MLLLTMGDGVALELLSQSQLTGEEEGVALGSLLHSPTSGRVTLAILSHSLIGDQPKELVGEENEGEIGEGDNL